MITLCKFGIHKWEYHEAEYSDVLMRALEIPSKPKERICKKCGKTEYLDVHCLGMNPPEFVYTWRDKL